MRTRLLSALALALPASLAAQQPAKPATPTPQQQQPPQRSANPITDSFKAYHTRYGGWIMAAFDSIPASKYGYKPTPVQQSFGYVAQHLEDANYQLCSRFSGTTHATTARDSLADTVKAKWPKDTLVARLKASFAFCESALAQVQDAKLTDELPSGPPGSGRTAPRVRFVLAYVTDLVDHWSQVANYMRLNGMVPPSAQPRPRS